MLTERDVIPYLLQKQLVSAAALVDGDLAVLEASRRNCTFHVVCGHGPGYVLKQGIDPASRATVAHEAVIYQALQPLAPTTGLASALPWYYGYDPHAHVLLLERVPAAASLRHLPGRRGRVPTGLAAAMGQVLGALHSLPRPADPPTACALGATRPPGVLGLHRPGLGLFQTVSRANLQLITMVQSSPALGQCLEALEQMWQAEALIHGDIKWDNWLAGDAPARAPRAVLVDWEFAGYGDPCWDVGAVFADYLSLWLFSIPLTGATPPEHLLALARYPLAALHPALRAFWQAYVRRRALDTPTAQRTLLRAVHYGAARLLQKGFEQLQTAPQLLGTTVCLVQLSLNIFQRPHEAAATLLGLPLSPGGTA
jgi:Ser/Thr protein kinase RdoA (MazF antagonist)